ncbi:hypothetical protein H5410_005226, partial [Solanum commersonii]
LKCGECVPIAFDELKVPFSESPNRSAIPMLSIVWIPKYWITLPPNISIFSLSTPKQACPCLPKATGDMSSGSLIAYLL